MIGRGMVCKVKALMCCAKSRVWCSLAVGGICSGGGVVMMMLAAVGKLSKRSTKGMQEVPPGHDSVDGHQP